MSSLTILTGRDVEHLITAPTFLPRALESQRSVFSAFSAQSSPERIDGDSKQQAGKGVGEIQIPPRLSVVMPKHKVLVMPSRAAKSGGTGCKIVSVPTSSGDTAGLPGSTVILDEVTGAVVGMVNARTLTALRNACGSALFYQSIQPLIAEKYPSHASPRNLTVFGSGHQAFHHINVFLNLFPSIELVTVVGRSASPRLTGMVDKLRDEWRGNIDGQGIWRGDRLGKRKVTINWGAAGTIGTEGEKGIEGGSEKSVGQHGADEKAQPGPVIPSKDGAEPKAATILESLKSATHNIPLINTPTSPSAPASATDPETEGNDAELAKSAARMKAEDEADVSDFELIGKSETGSTSLGGSAVSSRGESASRSGFGGSEVLSVDGGAPAEEDKPADPEMGQFNQSQSEGDKTPFDLSQTLHNSHIIICCTPSLQPLFASTHLTSGTSVILIGSYTSQMQEVQPELVRRAGVVVVDSREDCGREAGELIRAKGEGWQGVMVELGDLVSQDDSRAEEARRKVGDGGRDVFMYKSVGIGIQDVAIASACLAAAKALKVGTIVPHYD